MDAGLSKKGTSIAKQRREADLAERRAARERERRAKAASKKAQAA
jgi:hypothetical protein